MYIYSVDSEFRRIVRAFSLSEVKHKGFWEAVDSEILSRKRKNELSPRAFLNVLMYVCMIKKYLPYCCRTGCAVM